MSTASQVAQMARTPTTFNGINGLKIFKPWVFRQYLLKQVSYFFETSVDTTLSYTRLEFVFQSVLEKGQYIYETY